MKVFVIVFTLASPLGDVRVAAVERPGPFYKTEDACVEVLNSVKRRLQNSAKGASCVEIEKP